MKPEAVAQAGRAYGPVALPLILLTLLIGSPMRQDGFPPTHDGLLHVYRVVEAAHLLRWGVPYARWAPDLALGYGYPLFLFNAPYFPWATAGLVLLGLDPEQATKLHLALLFFIGGLGMYRLARQWLDGPAALLAAFAYMLAPFRLREAYWQGDYPQLAAQAFAPWVFWALHRLLADGRPSSRLAFSFSYALLILAHNITAMLSTLLLAGYGLALLALSRESRRHLPTALLAAGLGMAMAAFFWGPALMERPLVHLERLLAGHFDFRRHFLSLQRLTEPVPLHDQARGNAPEVLTVGLHQGLWVLPAGLMALRRPALRRPAALAAAGLAFAFFMMQPASRPLWERVPLLAFAEFPWRWLGLASLPLSLLVGLPAQGLRPPARTPWQIAALMALLIGSAPLLYPYGTFTPMHSATVCDLVAFETRSRLIGLTSVGELLPKTAGGVPEQPLWPDCARGGVADRLDRSSLPAGTTVRPVTLHPLGARYEVTSDRPFTARFLLFAYPGWEVRVDGQTRPWTATPTGWLQVDLPAGAYTLSLWWTETPLRRFFDGLSVAAWAAWAAALLRRWLQRARHRAPLPPEAIPVREALGLSLVLAGLLALKVLYVDSQTTLFRIRTSVEAPLGMTHPLGLRFGDAIELIGYRLEPEIPSPGETLQVYLYWRALRPMREQWSAFVHLLDRASGKAWAQSDHMHPGEMPTDAWRPDVYYLDLHRLRLPPHLPEGPYALRLGLYAQGHPDRPLPPQGSDRPDHFLFPVWVLRPGVWNYRRLEPPVAFGGMLHLVGYRADPPARPGGSLTLWLYWRAEKPLPEPYTSFVHLIGPDGRLWAQWDGWPYQGAYPTVEWPPGAVIPQRVTLSLPGDLPGGRYTLQVGWYRWPEMRHLEAEGRRAWTLPLAVEVRP
ncbi:6-pyruvoyl-tetrahydropterin synthase-related protein [Thermoflexus sp.]|uniref:6-pyruvoyl-tetrahydropterin synthase-related protein n=1 Tax=Thermoflexus sp. TaxID=1969742 RepID=UPI00331FDD9C